MSARRRSSARRTRAPGRAAVRVSPGVENVADIISDLRVALARV